MKTPLGLIRVQLSDAPTVKRWRPEAAGLQSVRVQGRYDQSRTEEHPAASESDDDDDEVGDAQQPKYELTLFSVSVCKCVKATFSILQYQTSWVRFCRWGYGTDIRV